MSTRWAVRADRAFDGSRFLSGGATVVVEGDRIAGVEPAAFELPSDVPVTDSLRAQVAAGVTIRADVPQLAVAARARHPRRLRARRGRDARQAPRTPVAIDRLVVDGDVEADVTALSRPVAVWVGGARADA